jgi:hypothetical protein
MTQNEFEDLIDSLVESVTLNYDLDDSFDHYDAIIEVCENCNYSFEYYRAWQLVNFVRFDMYDNGAKLQLFDEVEMEVKENGHNTDDVNLDDYMLSFAFNILKVATLKKYNEQESEVMA